MELLTDDWPVFRARFLDAIVSFTLIRCFLNLTAGFDEQAPAWVVRRARSMSRCFSISTSWSSDGPGCSG